MLQAVSILAGVILLVLISLVIAQAGEGDWFIFRGVHQHLHEIMSCSVPVCKATQQAARDSRTRSCCAADIYDAATHIGKGSWSSVVLGAFLGAVACALLAFVWHLSTDAGSGQSLCWAAMQTSDADQHHSLLQCDLPNAPSQLCPSWGSLAAWRRH